MSLRWEYDAARKQTKKERKYDLNKTINKTIKDLFKRKKKKKKKKESFFSGDNGVYDRNDNRATVTTTKKQPAPAVKKVKVKKVAVKKKVQPAKMTYTSRLEQEGWRVNDTMNPYQKDVFKKQDAEKKASDTAYAKKNKYKDGQKLKPSIYTGDPTDYSKYAETAKHLDKSADVTVFDKKAGKFKGQKWQTYYSDPKNKKEALKKKAEIEKTYNEHPFLASTANAIMRGWTGKDMEKEDREKFKGVAPDVKKKVTTFKKGGKLYKQVETKVKDNSRLNIDKYDKSGYKKLGELTGTAAVFATPAAAEGAIAKGLTKAGAKLLSKAAVKKVTTKALAKGAQRVATKGVSKEAAKVINKEASKAMTKVASNAAKSRVKTFAAKRAADVIANAPNNILDAKGRADKNNSFEKNLKENIGMDMLFGTALNGIEGAVKGIKGKKALKEAKLKSAKNLSKDTIEKVRREITIKNKKTGETIYKGTPISNKKIVIKNAVRKAGGVDNIKIESTPKGKGLKDINNKKLLEDVKAEKAKGKLSKEVETKGEKRFAETKGKGADPKVEKLSEEKLVKGELPEVETKRESPLKQEGKLPKHEETLKESKKTREKVFDEKTLEKKNNIGKELEHGEKFPEPPEPVERLSSPKREKPIEELPERGEVPKESRLEKTREKGVDEKAKTEKGKTYKEDNISKEKEPELKENLPEEKLVEGELPEVEKLAKKKETLEKTNKKVGGTPEEEAIVKGQDKTKEALPVKDSLEEIDEQFKEAGKKYGTYDKANVPKSVTGKKKVHKAVDTAMSERAGTKGIVQDEEVKKNLKESILDDELSFTTRKQKDAKAIAYREVEKDPEQALRDFTNDSTANDITVAKGVALYDHFIAKGDIKAASDIISQTSIKLGETGRGLAASKMLMRATPAGRAKVVTDLAKKLQEKFYARLGGKEIKISDETLEAIHKAKGTGDISKAMEKAKIEMWNQVPATWFEKFNAWRYLAMLGNPKTHIRNIIGNVGFMLPREVKNIIATGAERIAEKAGKINKNDRTKALINLFNKEDKELYMFGKKSFSDNEAVLRGQSRWSDAARPQESKTFNSKIIDKAAKTTGALLDVEDVVFMRPAYSMAMARYMKAQGLRPKDMKGAILKRAESVAGEEALRATYRDASELSTALAKIKAVDSTSPKIKKAAAIAVESMIPFSKTPVNLLRRAVDYSPVGLLQGTARLLKASTGKQVAAALDKLCAGLTGSGIVTVGYWLADKGILTVKLGDEDEDKYKRDLGEQGYAIKVGDKSYTMDWFAPASMPFFTGATMCMKAKEAKGVEFHDAADSLAGLLNPITEMSMMQGVSNLFESIRKKSENTIADVNVNVALNYLSQANPTLFGQIARQIDPVVRNTKSDKQGDLVSAIDAWKNRQVAKLPGLSKTLQPKVNVWGKTKKYGGPAERFLEGFLSPGYYSETKKTDTDKEILRLAKKVDNEDKSKVIPKLSKFKTATFKGKEIPLSSKAMTIRDKKAGKEAFKRISALIDSAEYARMNDKERSEAIQKEYRRANEWGKQEALIKLGKNKFDVRTDGWKGSTLKAAKQYNKKHDIDDIIKVNRELQKYGISTAPKHNKNLHAFILSERKSNKDLEKYFNVDKKAKKDISKYKKYGGSVRELSTTQKNIKDVAKSMGYENAGQTKSGRAYALAKTGGANRLAYLYDDSTPNSRDYYKQTFEMGKGMYIHGIDPKLIRKIKNGKPVLRKSVAVPYINKHYKTQAEKQIMFRALGAWNAKNPYGNYVAPKNNKKLKKARAANAPFPEISREAFAKIWAKDKLEYANRVADKRKALDKAIKKGDPSKTKAYLKAGKINDIIKAANDLFGKDTSFVEDLIKETKKVVNKDAKDYDKTGSLKWGGRRGRRGWRHYRRRYGARGGGSEALGTATVGREGWNVPAGSLGTRRNAVTLAQLRRLLKELTEASSQKNTSVGDLPQPTKFKKG